MRTDSQIDSTFSFAVKHAQRSPEESFNNALKEQRDLAAKLIKSKAESKDK